MSTDHTAAIAAPSVHGEGLRVVRRGRAILDVDRIELAAGRTYALLGASGAGKSTLLRVLGLLERPTAGTVMLGGRVVDRHDIRARRDIAAVFQKPYLLRGTVADNVGYGLRLRGVGGPEARRRIGDALARVGLSGWEERSALTLSGGEAQRVALARALVLEPRLLLLDEPLSYMDPLLRRDLIQEFAHILASERLTALYVTHDQDEAVAVADRIGIMRAGRLVCEGDPDTVLGLPQDEWTAAFVGMEPPLRGRVTVQVEGLATIAVGDVEVFATSSLPVGADVLVAVRPEDVTLWEAGAELPHGSVRNRLSCRVVGIRPRGGSVQVVLECGGARFAASVSRASASELGVTAGTPLVAAFKATAVNVRSMET